jgi:hypothetical protein
MTDKNIENINKIAMLLDIIGQYLGDIEPEARHNIRMVINPAIRATAKFIKEVDKILGEYKQGKHHHLHSLYLSL